MSITCEHQNDSSHTDNTIETTIFIKSGQSLYVEQVITISMLEDNGTLHNITKFCDQEHIQGGLESLLPSKEIRDKVDKILRLNKSKQLENNTEIKPLIQKEDPKSVQQRAANVKIVTIGSIIDERSESSWRGIHPSIKIDNDIRPGFKARNKRAIDHLVYVSNQNFQPGNTYQNRSQIVADRRKRLRLEIDQLRLILIYDHYLKNPMIISTCDPDKSITPRNIADCAREILKTETNFNKHREEFYNLVDMLLKSSYHMLAK